jgi:hypothetical protein
MSANKTLGRLPSNSAAGPEKTGQHATNNKILQQDKKWEHSLLSTYGGRKRSQAVDPLSLSFAK